MKKIALVAAAVFLAASLTGCNKKPAAAAGKHEKVTIKFGRFKCKQCFG